MQIVINLSQFHLAQIAMRFYNILLMYKPTRSTSQYFFKYRQVQTQPIQSIPLRTQERLLQKSKQLLKTQNSRQTFGQAKSINRSDSLGLRRNKSLSSSKSKLFQKAHEVKKNETFNKISTPHTNKACLSMSNFQFSQYKKDKSLANLNDIVERKLIISKVMASGQENKPRLTLRGQLFKSQLQKHKNDQIVQKKDNRFVKDHNWHVDFNHSKVMSQLTYSKQFENQKYGNQSVNIPPHEANEELLKNYSRQLSHSIKQSLKKQLQQHYLQKEQQLEQRYKQKQKQYQSKLENIQTKMEKQLGKERDILLATINQQIQGQLAKEKPDQKLIKNIIEERKIGENKNEYTIEILKPKKQVEIKQAVNSDAIKEVKTVQRQKTNISQSQPKNSKTIQQVKPIKNVKTAHKLPPTTNNKSKTTFNEMDSSYLDQIQQIQIDKNEKKPLIKGITRKQSQDDHVNKSFNLQKKHDSSFSSERPVPNKAINKPNKKQEEVNQPHVRKLSEEQKSKAKEQQRKIYVRNKIKQQVQNDGILISIGQVAGYCSKLCKKSKIDWRMPSLLLYRYCLDFFRSFKLLYVQAEQLKLIKRQQLDNYKSYDNVMQQNLSKMYKSIGKKIPISDFYKELLESPEIELQRLRPYAVLQAKKYVEQLRKSSECSLSADKLVLQCGLRIINSVFVIKKLNGKQVELISRNIDELSQEETYNLFLEWSQKLKEA